MLLNYNHEQSKKKQGRAYSFYQKRAKFASFNRSPKIPQHNDIFCLTSKNKTISSFTDIQKVNSKTNRKRMITSFSMKSNSSYVHIKINNQDTSNCSLPKQFQNLNGIQTKGLIDQQFDSQCEQAHKYSKFKSKFGNRNQMIFLKPHLKQIKVNTPISQMKSILYEQINKSNLIQEQIIDKKSRIIHYCLQYNPDSKKGIQQISKTVACKKKKIGYSNILRQKLRKYYSVSQYSEKIREQNNKNI